MILNDKRGNLRNIERFESLAFCHSSSAGRRFNPYTAHQTSLARAGGYSGVAPLYCRRRINTSTDLSFQAVKQRK